MRIIYFPKIVAQEAKLVSLKNCSVVIDGQNFLHNTYEESGLPFIFGCETNKYDNYLKKHLKMFKDANVTCYIVLKGGDSDIEKKLKRFQHSYYDFESQTEFVAPIILSDVCKQVLDEMRINYSTCVTESKDECVALASQLNCPVISQDIEFCFKQTSYIPHTTMQFVEADKSIVCRQFTLHDFLQKHSLTIEKVALFAALSDVHTFPQGFFNSLLKTWRVLDVRMNIQIMKLIKWLATHSEHEAKDHISKSLRNQDDRQTFWLNYDKIMANIKPKQPGIVSDYLMSQLTIAPQDPSWFEKGVALKHVMPVYVNLYKWKVIEGSWVIKDKTSPDSLLIAIDIVKYAYNLLTNFKRDTFRVYQDAEHYVTLDSEDPNVSKPQYDCIESVFENGWSQVRRWRLFEHFLRSKQISVDVLANLDEGAVVLFAALVHFARKKRSAGEDVTSEVYAVIISYVMLNVVQNDDTFIIKSYGITEHDCTSVTGSTVKYFRFTQDEAQKIFDENASKRLVEFQYCLQNLNNLNILCGTPFKSAIFGKIYNGTFVSKLCYDMRGTDGDEFVKSLLESAPSVLALVERLITIYKELLN